MVPFFIFTADFGFVKCPDITGSLSECHRICRSDKLGYASQREIIFKFQFAGPKSISAIISTGQIIVFQIYLADSYQEYEGARVKPGSETYELPYSISLEAPVPIVSEEQNLPSASYVRQSRRELSSIVLRPSKK